MEGFVVSCHSWIGVGERRAVGGGLSGSKSALSFRFLSSRAQRVFGGLQRRSVNRRLTIMCAEKDAEELTVGDAVREWQVAKDKGETPLEAEMMEQYTKGDRRFKILFMCRDNATTSVVAEAIFRDLIERRGYGKYVSVDSAGYRAAEGERPPEEFSIALQFRRKLDIKEHSAKKLVPSDIDVYHLIVCMDEKTKQHVLYSKLGNTSGNTSDADKKNEKMLLKKVRLLSHYCTLDKLKKMEFPSGAYSRAAMRIMLSSVVDGCNGLLTRLSSGIEKTKQQEKNSGGGSTPSG